MEKQIKMTISILGCGWLGLPLAEKFLEKGFAVNGSTTTTSKLEVLKKKGIDAFYIELTEEKVKGEVFSFLDGAKVLVVDIPPGLRQKPDVDFVEKMKHFIKKLELSSVEKVILVSSTSVFEDEESIPAYTENSMTNGKSSSSKQIQEVEKLFQTNSNFKTNVIRMGGLLGEDRHPAKFLAGRENISNPDAPVNLIHQKDCLGLIFKVLEQENFGKVFHGVYPNHPSKNEYYSAKANELHLEAPKFASGAKSKGKKISSEETQQMLDFQFEHQP
ncbi:NAD(P)H-binding protein [Mesonia aestuariivivens]|uniref:NAD(P)H-binding protein n=1 Tax=Mesonia aestuariivivens TaxID=2796128 RepID=A0ABS6W273_9FLAO|nr:NAD(P)H-binding protein [Mesonia aestuariivivens]MBW2961914.1 NAD(P)H-binding protein [Mesonia aestuariivivens]